MARRGVTWMVRHLAMVTTAVTGVLLVAIIAAFVILVPLSGRVAEQARAGEKALVTQCDREPVIRKVADAAYAVRRELPADSRITANELEIFKQQAPRGCPSEK